MRKWAIRRRLQDGRGQSLVEITLFIPILLLLLIGFIEVGVLVNAYIFATDSSRAAARYVSALDPFVTRCQPFGDSTTDPKTGWFDKEFTEDCSDADYLDRAAIVKSWGADLVYDRCQTSNTLNFFYIAGCMAVRNLPKGALDPNPKSVWAANDYAGDDVVVTTIPVKGGAIVPSWDFESKHYVGQHVWSLYGNQPTAAYPSFVDTNFASIVASYPNAPATGLVVVEVYRAHPQLTKLFAAVNGLARSTAVIPDPIPVHTYSVFPLPAIEPK
jgi:hypothetical protein